MRYGYRYYKRRFAARRSGARTYRGRYGTRTRFARTYRRRASAKTTSKTIKLTLDSTWTFRQSSSGVWSAFNFSPVLIPGFIDYATTYTHFRLIKANLYISRTLGEDTGSLNNYLVVGSRPYASLTAPSSTTSFQSYLVPPQTEEALRQSRWQKVKYPSTTTQRVRVGFKPYTMIATFGPAQDGTSNNAYQRIYEGRKWMPFTWAKPVTGTNQAASKALRFWGPYMVIDTNTGNGEIPTTETLTGNCTLELYCQFKGQQ